MHIQPQCKLARLVIYQASTNVFAAKLGTTAGLIVFREFFSSPKVLSAAVHNSESSTSSWVSFAKAALMSSWSANICSTKACASLL